MFQELVGDVMYIIEVHPPDCTHLKVGGPLTIAPDTGLSKVTKQSEATTLIVPEFPLVPLPL
jgi:hypothetical protein